jgi:hypothetical protein
VKPFALGLVYLSVAVAACEQAEPAPREANPAPPAVEAPVQPAEQAAGPASRDELEPIPAPEFARLFRELSEPDRYFFSDNYVSNETSYLEVAPLLDRHARKGGAYLGVGPEQNLSYIALLEPKLAFIVDIRRQNALQHLLFKAIFHEAGGRAHFLALLFGRRFDPSTEPPEGAGVQAVLDAVQRSEPDRGLFAATHQRLRARITAEFGIELSAGDREALERTQRVFFDQQAAIRFVLHEQNGRKYPPLSELLSARDPSGTERSFLATGRSFALLKSLHEKNRILPVVGDFAGDHALKAVAAELRRRDLPVSAFYVSNVEQYVIEPEKWRAYVANVLALPSDEQSLFIRCYLDQGRRHPRQPQGHRTATLLQRFDHFKWRQQKKSYTGFWELATDGNL